jgi:hypothetical protein
MNLINALSLGCGNVAEQGVLLCSSSIGADPIDFVLCDETLIYIREHLPENLLESFGDLICNNRLRSTLVEEIRQKIAEILVEREDNARSRE